MANDLARCRATITVAGETHRCRLDTHPSNRSHLYDLRSAMNRDSRTYGPGDPADEYADTSRPLRIVQ